MARNVRIRFGRAVVGLVAAVGASAAVGVLLGAPGYAATTGPGSPAVAAATTSTTSGTASTTTTWRDPTPATSTTSSSTSCYSWTPPTVGADGVSQRWDFEDGTAQNWYALSESGVSLANTTEAAAGGTRSLKVSGITSTAYVTATASGLPNFGWYQVTAKVRLAAGRSSAFVALKPATYSSSSLPGTVRATSDGWAEVTAWFRPGTLYADWYCNGHMTGTQEPAATGVQLALDVVSCDGATADLPTALYVDDVVLRPTSSAVGGGSSSGTPGPQQTADCTTTTTPPPAECSARYRIVSQWPGGFQAAIDVTNTSNSPLTGWKLGWTFPGDERVTSLWGAASWTQNGRAVSLTGADWAPLRAGGSASVGFVGTASGAARAPDAISLNGHFCLTTGA